MSAKDDIHTGSIVLVGVVGAILLFALIVAMQAVFLHAEEAETYDKVIRLRDDDVRGLRADQLGVLHSYRWVDKQKGVVAIPIDRAMDSVVREEAR